MKLLCILVALTVLGGRASANTGVSASGPLDSRSPVIQILRPAGGEIFRSSAPETIRFTIDEQSWGQAPANITLGFMPNGSTPTAVALSPEPDGSYVYVWDVPTLPGTASTSAFVSVAAKDSFGWQAARLSGGFTILDDVTAVPVPAASDQLGPIYPNPFNPATKIAFHLAQAADIRLAVYDLRGRQVAELVRGPQTAGSHQATWSGLLSDGSRAASGVYLARLDIEGSASSRTFVSRLVLVK